VEAERLPPELRVAKWEGCQALVRLLELVLLVVQGPGAVTRLRLELTPNMEVEVVVAVAPELHLPLVQQVVLHCTAAELVAVVVHAAQATLQLMVDKVEVVTVILQVAVEQEAQLLPEEQAATVILQAAELVAVAVVSQQPAVYAQQEILVEQAERVEYLAAAAAAELVT
jgi:hypothetical protein